MIIKTKRPVYRTGDIGLKTYLNLPQQEKDAHILALLQLKENELSERDWCILEYFGPAVEKENNLFISNKDNFTF